MTFPVLARALKEMRWTIFWFGAGLALYGASMILLYPQFEDYLEEVAATYPEGILDFFGGGDITTPQGFLTLEYHTFAVIIMMIFALVVATGTLAGEEGRGTAEILLAQPLPRWRVIVEKAMAVLAGALLVFAIICAGWLVSVPLVDLHGELTLLQLIEATLGMLPTVALFTALGFFFGAVAPSRGFAAGILVALAVAAYLVASLAQVVQPIEWARFLSPYYYSDGSRWLIDGPVWWHQLLLVASSGLIFALAVRAFEGREIGTGAWQLHALLRGAPPRRPAGGPPSAPA